MVGQAEELVADDIVRETQAALQPIEGAGGRNDVEEDVVALFLLVDGVGEATLAPPLGLADHSAIGRLHLIGDGLDPALGGGLVEIAVEDDPELIGTPGV
jgi:hypothetical protein